MKRILFLLGIMFLLSFAVRAQTVDSLWNGYLSPFVQTGGTAPSFTVQGQFVSNGGFSGSQINLSLKPRLIVYSSNKCYELPFTALSGTGSIIAGTVIDLSGTLSALPSGSAIIYQPSSVHRVGPFPTGVSASLQGCLQTYNNLKIDSLVLSGGSGVTVGDKQDIDVVSTNVWVIDTGVVNTLKLAANAVDSTKLAANSVQSTDIGPGQVMRTDIATGAVDSTKVATLALPLSRLNASGATTGQVPKWDGTKWVASADATGGGISIPSPRIPVGNGTGLNSYTNLIYTVSDSALSAKRYKVPLDTINGNKFSIPFPRTAVNWRVQSGGTYGENGDTTRNNVVSMGFNLNKLDDINSHEFRIGMENSYLPFPGAGFRWAELHIPEIKTTNGSILRPGSWTGRTDNGTGNWTWAAEQHTWQNSAQTQGLMTLINGVFEVNSNTSSTQEFRIRNANTLYGQLNINMTPDGGISMYNGSTNTAVTKAITVFPGEYMDVRGTGLSPYNMIVNGKNLSNDRGYFHSTAGTAGQRYLVDGTSGADTYVMQMTTTKADALNRIFLNGTGTNNKSEILFARSAGAFGWYLRYTSANDDLAFINQSTTQMYLKQSTGNVAIGNQTNPARKLHVEGEARITDLTTDTPTRIVGADADGDLGEIALTGNVKIVGGVINVAATLMREESFTSTASQTAFTIAYSAPAVSSTSVPLRVYRNGMRLFYTASGPGATQFTFSGTSVTTAANTAGDIITVEYLN